MCVSIVFDEKARQTSLTTYSADKKKFKKEYFFPEKKLILQRGYYDLSNNAQFKFDVL